ncbi:Hypothetical predicted protein, partial [Pelobates cultripes]
FSEPYSGDRKSQISVFSSNSQDAFDEIELIAPHTGSSESIEYLDNSSDKEFLLSDSSDKAICRHEITDFGCCSNDEGILADIRLSLLDHENWGNENHIFEANIESSSSVREGLLLPPAPAVLNEANTSDISSNATLDVLENINTIVKSLGNMNIGSEEMLLSEAETNVNNIKMDSSKLPIVPDLPSPMHWK